MALSGNDDVIMHKDTQLVPGRDNFLGYVNVGKRRRGITRWVVMHHDNGAGSKFQRALHHFAGLNRRVIHCPALLHFIGDQLVFLAHEQQAKAFGLFIGHGGAAVIDDRVPR